AMDKPQTDKTGRSSLRLPSPSGIFLATLALAMVSLGVWLGGPIYQREVAIRRAARRIEELGGSIGWSGNFVSDSIEELIDCDLPHLSLFEDVVSVHLGSGHATDADMVCLAAFPNLRDLWLTNCPITDAGLAQVEGL